MSTARLIVELSPSRIEIATLRGAGIAEWRCERIGRAEWPSPYTTSLADSAGIIAKLLGEIGVSTGAATLIYSAPGSVTGLTSCAVSINAAGAEQAALLALANIADFPIEDAPSDTCTLLSDKAAKGSADAATPAAQRHILACAEAEQRAAAICAALSGAGLNVDRLIPADAVALADAVKLAVAAPAGEISAVIWIGEHSTNLAVGSSGRLFFVRTIAAGTEGLAEVLCRPLRPRDPESQPITLAHDDARTLLLSAGVPAADAPIAAYPTLAGSSLLPHLQPILQRMSIEIKQSLRFGVPESDRPNVRLHLAGPGAAVPGLGDAIARVSGFPFDQDSSQEAADALDSSTGGLIAAFARCPTLTIGLLPSDVRRTRGIARARKALLVGAALALAYVGYESFDAYTGLRAEKDKLNTLGSALQSSEGPMALRQQAVAARCAVGDAERRLRKSMEQSPDWSSLLEALAETTPEEIRLTAMDMRRDGTKCSLSVRGHIRFEEVRDPAALIRSYVGKLEAVPLIEPGGVRLGATQRTALSGHDSQTFELTIAAVALPSDFATARTPPASTPPTALTAHPTEAK